MPTNNTHNYNIGINAIKDSVFIFDVDNGAIIKVNEAMLSMYGYTLEDIDKLTINDLSANDPLYDHRHIMQRIRSTLSDGSQTFEWKGKKKSGEHFWAEISLTREALDDCQRMLAMVRDITQRKQTKLKYQKIKQQSEFINFTLNQVKIAVFWCHANGFFFYVNGTACRWLQYSNEELLKMHVSDINPEFPRETWSNHWHRIKEQGRVKIKSVHRRKNSEVYPVEIYLNYLNIGGKEYKVAFVHDISAQRKAEQEKQALEDRMRQAQKMEAIGTLAGGVAHDLNNLLSPILGYAELLNDEFSTNEQSRSRLNQIYKAGLRARNLTRQLLTFGRKESLSLGPVDLNEVIIDFEKMLRRIIRENIIFHKRLAPSLPAIEGDVGQLEQIILNLAVNAQDAMPNGGTLSIETKAKYLDEAFPEFGSDDKAGAYIMMAISDTGVGMDKETQERIFEPFFTTKEKEQGTGLGLATVYGIVKLHEGYLWTYSKPDYGTTMKVFLPISEKPILKPINKASARPAVHNKETILVVEDQEQVLMLAKHILERCGYTVLTADNVSAAIDIADHSGSCAALLLADVVMPGLNGNALYEKLVERWPKLKVLYMSGYTVDVIGHHGIMEEGINFISKPFCVKELESMVCKALGR